MYESLPQFVYGFRGCDAMVADQVIGANGSLRPSENDYDWLGHGIYFWENNPARALLFAKGLSAHPEWTEGKPGVKAPAVVGAVIDLGRCLNLMESASLLEVKNAYLLMRDSLTELDLPLPANEGVRRDRPLRKLDCAVMQYLHALRDYKGLDPYESVRGVFVEGGELYPDSGFREKNHIQICVRNPNCIKGYFHPREEGQWPARGRRQAGAGE